jgi:hypothetical protein
MIFCDEIFRFLNLEETLYFTKLDIEFNSMKEGTKIDERLLLDLNQQIMTNTFTCNLKGVRSSSKSVARASDEEIKQMVDQTINSKEQVASIFESINDILFSEDSNVRESKVYEIDPEKVADFNDNYLFNKFHHLFEYDATYYSYLLAKIASQKLYSNEVNPVNSDENLTVSNQIHSLFEKGAMYDARDIASK